METAARLARIGNRLIDFAVILLILVMFLYGGYSLWDTYMVYHGAFVSGDLLKFKPAAEGAEENPTLAKLQQINPDVRAWLTIDDTHIDYPVVQGETDMDYINQDVYGEFSLSGSIFLSCVNAPDFTDPYSLLYGHHMDNGGMFGDVVEFTDSRYFEEHPTGTLYLPDGTYAVTLFACLEVDAYDRVVYDPQACTREGTGELLSYIRSQAVQYRDVEVTEENALIGLSTCAEAETNGRVVVFGRLDRKNEEGGK